MVGLVGRHGGCKRFAGKSLEIAPALAITLLVEGLQAYRAVTVQQDRWVAVRVFRSSERAVRKVEKDTVVGFTDPLDLGGAVLIDVIAHLAFQRIEVGVREFVLLNVIVLVAAVCLRDDLPQLLLGRNFVAEAYRDGDDRRELMRPLWRVLSFAVVGAGDPGNPIRVVNPRTNMSAHQLSLLSEDVRQTLEQQLGLTVVRNIDREVRLVAVTAIDDVGVGQIAS